MIKKSLLILAAAFLCVSLPGKAQNIQLADTLRSKGESFQIKGNFKQAEFYYKEALNLYNQLGDTASSLKTGLYYAEVLSYRAKYNEAKALFDSLQKVNHPANDLSYNARIQSDLGFLNGRMGNTDQAVSHYKEGLVFAERANDSLMTGILYNNLGHNTSGQESMNFYKKALPYFEGLKNQRSLAITLANIGRIYEDLLLYDKALEYFNKSLSIREELKNVNLLATIHQSLGTLQQKRGNYRQALIALQKSLDFRRKAGAPLQTASTLNSIGILYGQLGDAPKALAYYQESLTLKKSFASQKDLAISYKNIGAKLWDVGKKEEAESYFKKAVQIKRKLNNSELLFSSLIDLAKVELDKKKYSVAKNYAKEAYSIADSLQSYEHLLSSNMMMGKIANAQGKAQTSLQYYKKAYSYSEFLPQNKRVSPSINLAKSYRKMESDSALIYGKNAINIIEKQRIQAGDVSDLRASYFHRYYDFYIEMASWELFFTGDNNKAFGLLEAAKARTLAEELNEATRQAASNLPEDVRIERNKKLTAIDRLYSRLDQTISEEQRREVERKIRNAELQYEAYQNTLHYKYPAYKKLTASSPVSLQTAQAINSEDTAILEFAVAENTLLAFLISADGVVVHQVSLQAIQKQAGSISGLTDLIQNFKDAILSLASRQELDLHSDKLYKILIKPFEEPLQEFSKLIIVPDGPLAYLPFEALRMNDAYMIEQFDIKYEPSVTSYTLLKKPQKHHQKQLLAIAGSGVSDNALSVNSRQSGLSALPSTIIEVDSVSSYFSNSEIIKKENITEQALKKMLNTSYRFVHLATHGVIDEDDPKQSGLVLSTAGELNASSEEDGLLKSSEIYRLNLNSDMVVLSACNTGLGKYVKGEGMLGLQRSFFYAGSSSVVVSLWSVYDRSTAHLMNEFYRSIMNSTEELSWYVSFMKWIGWDQTISYGQKASSMRKAKLKLINHPLFNHPVYWAPFIVVGR